MKNILPIILISVFLNSCCLFTSQDCGCSPAQPFLLESTKEWIIPFSSEKQLFFSTDTLQQDQNVFRVFQKGIECVGGDECCTNFPIYTTSFLFDTINKNKTLLYTKAIKNVVEFYSEINGFPLETYIASLDVNTNKFSKSDTINLFESDTTIKGLKYQKVTFHKKNSTQNKILFESLEFVKGIGVTAYIDTLGKTWTKK